MPQEIKFMFALALFLAPIYLLLVWVNAALLGSNGAFSDFTLIGLLIVAVSAFAGLDKFQKKIGEEGVAAEMSSLSGAVYFAFKSALWPLFLKG